MDFGLSKILPSILAEPLRIQEKLKIKEFR